MNRFLLKNVLSTFSVKKGILTLLVALGFSSCERNSSPEGRMSIQLEKLQQGMVDSLHQQNKAILDSLGQIRKELQQLQQLRK